MANSTRQVPPQIPRNEEWTVEEIEQDLRKLAVLWEPFRVEGTGKRRYPGEGEGAYLVRYLADDPSTARQFLRSIDLLTQIEQARRRQDVEAIHQLRHKMRAAYNPLVEAINKRKAPVGVGAEGLIMQPETPAGNAALAILLLEKFDRLHRLRRCLHCGAPFYARFKHQQFCPDPEKKCQWNHYHTPEWRKKNRERNKKHQRAYRDRLFGPPRRPRQ